MSKFLRKIRSLYNFWKTPFSKFLDVLIWHLPQKLWPRFLGAKSLQMNTNVKFGFSDLDDLYYVESNGNRLFVSHPRRMWLYLAGVDRRLKGLADSYCLLEIKVPDRSVVIDVGANAGELGVYFGDRITYIGFEPDPMPYRALVRNNSEQLCFQKALSDKNGRGNLRIATSSADTHLEIDGGRGPGNILEVDVISLDSALDSLEIESIFLMKVEAEGHEPEILRGAIETLKKTEYVALDCGPEREGKDTAAACLEVLYSVGFLVVDSKMLSGRVLLRRKPTVAESRQLTE